MANHKEDMNFAKITSVSNPRIKNVLALRKSGAGRESNIFLIEGKNLVESALDAGVSIRDIYISEDFLKKGHEFGRRLAGSGTAVFEIAEHISRKLSDTESPQGIIAVVEYRVPSLDELSFGGTPFLVAVDRVQDPGNLGSIIRTTDAVGADALFLLPGSCDAFMPKVVRATTGSIFHVPIIRIGTAEFLNWLAKKNIALAGASADAAQTVFDSPLDRPLAFVFGNEPQGLSTEIREAADLLVKVPIYGKAESLNVAAAASVCLYETRRQRDHH